MSAGSGWGRPRSRRAWIFALLLAAGSILLHDPQLAAQQPTPPSAQPLQPRADSAALRDTVQFRPESVLPPGAVRPRTAFLRSLVAPGWGQASLGANRRALVYSTGAVGILGMLGKSYYFYDRSRSRDDQRTGLLRDSLTRRAQADGDSTERRLLLLAARDTTFESPLTRARRRQVEDWAFPAIFWFFFSGADAYVSSYLQGFSDRVQVERTPRGETRIQATFPIGPPRR